MDRAEALAEYREAVATFRERGAQAVKARDDVNAWHLHIRAADLAKQRATALALKWRIDGREPA